MIKGLGENLDPQSFPVSGFLKKNEEITKVIVPVLAASSSQGFAESMGIGCAALALNDGAQYAVFENLFPFLGNQPFLNLTSVCARWSKAVIGFYSAQELRFLGYFIDEMCRPEDAVFLKAAAEEKLKKAKTLKELETAVEDFLSIDLEIPELSTENLMQLQEELHRFSNLIQAFVCKLIIGKLKSEGAPQLKEANEKLEEKMRSGVAFSLLLSERLCVADLVLAIRKQIIKLVELKEFSCAIEETKSIKWECRSIIKFICGAILNIKNFSTSFGFMEKLLLAHENPLFYDTFETIKQSKIQLLTQQIDSGYIEDVIIKINHFDEKYRRTFANACFKHFFFKNVDFNTVPILFSKIANNEIKIDFLNEFYLACKTKWVLTVNSNEVLKILVQCQAEIDLTADPQLLEDDYQLSIHLFSALTIVRPTDLATIQVLFEHLKRIEEHDPGAFIDSFPKQTASEFLENLESDAFTLKGDAKTIEELRSQSLIWINQCPRPKKTSLRKFILRALSPK